MPTFCLSIPAFKFAMRLVRTKAFQNLGATAHLPRYKECVGGVGGAAGPGPEEDARARYKEYVNCIVRIGAITGYHPLGTARMGQPDDPQAVVDLQLRSVCYLLLCCLNNFHRSR